MQYWCKRKSSCSDCCLLRSCCQPGQVADSSDPLRPGPPTGSCERFHGLSESHWVNDIKHSIAASPVWDRCL